jgi:hypothetical protein
MDYIDYIQTMPPSHPTLTRTSAPPFITIPNTTDAEWHTLIERLHNAVIDVSTHFFNITFEHNEMITHDVWSYAYLKMRDILLSPCFFSENEHYLNIPVSRSWQRRFTKINDIVATWPNTSNFRWDLRELQYAFEAVLIGIDGMPAANYDEYCSAVNILDV